MKERPDPDDVFHDFLMKQKALTPERLREIKGLLRIDYVSDCMAVSLYDALMACVAELEKKNAEIEKSSQEIDRPAWWGCWWAVGRSSGR